MKILTYSAMHHRVPHWPYSKTVSGRPIVKPKDNGLRHTQARTTMYLTYPVHQTNPLYLTIRDQINDQNSDWIKIRAEIESDIGPEIGL